MKKNSFIKMILLIFLTVFSLTVFAQPDPFGGPGDPDPAAPFDGGILCVIAGALGLGIKKLVSGINKT